MADTERVVVGVAKVTVVIHVTQIIPTVGIVTGPGYLNYTHFIFYLLFFYISD